MLAIDFFERGVARYPNNVLITDESITITYRQMSGIADSAARALIANGTLPGDRIAILSPNHPMVLACQYATIKAGAVSVPANYRNLPADSVRQFNSLEVNWLFFHSSLADHVASIRDQIPSVRAMVCIDRATDFAPHLSDWLRDAPKELTFPARVSEDPAVILTTSGTTGQPKGAVHTHRSWEAMVASFSAMTHFDEPPRHLIAAPLTHAAGVYHWTVLALGGTNFLAPSADPETILRMIEKHRISVLFLPPTVIYMLLSHPNLRKYDYSSLRYFIYGAAPMSVDKLKEAVAAFGPVMLQCYGQSECLMMGAILTREEHTEILNDPELRHRIAAAGREGPFCRVEIMNDDGMLLPPGERGEIVMSSQLVMSGYYNNPEATAETRAGIWHCTGDLGYKDDDGYVYLVDRKRDMIISGGFNVYPGEVEQAALGYPAVRDCSVVGVPHEKWGEAVLAAVELKPGQPFDKEAFLAFCKERLGSIKTPKFVEIWDTLPRSTVGKTLRREVRARYWKGRDRTI